MWKWDGTSTEICWFITQPDPKFVLMMMMMMMGERGDLQRCRESLRCSLPDRVWSGRPGWPPHEARPGSGWTPLPMQTLIHTHTTNTHTHSKQTSSEKANTGENPHQYGSIWKHLVWKVSERCCRTLVWQHLHFATGKLFDKVSEAPRPRNQNQRLAARDV